MTDSHNLLTTASQPQSAIPKAALLLESTSISGSMDESEHVISNFCHTWGKDVLLHCDNYLPYIDMQDKRTPSVQSNRCSGLSTWHAVVSCGSGDMQPIPGIALSTVPHQLTGSKVNSLSGLFSANS